MQQERKRSRALPPEGWIGESKSVKKRQVINVFSSYLRFIFLIILALTIFMKIKEYQYNFFLHISSNLQGKVQQWKRCNYSLFEPDFSKEQVLFFHKIRSNTELSILFIDQLFKERLVWTRCNNKFQHTLPMMWSTGYQAPNNSYLIQHMTAWFNTLSLAS